MSKIMDEVCYRYTEEVKSSLKREIEKRIEELNLTAIHGHLTSNTKIAIEENKRFLELLNTVEP